MTSTGPADVGVSARGRATPGRPVLARAVFPGFASSKPALGRLASRSRRLRPTLPRPQQQHVRARRPPGPPALANPLYLYLLEWPAAAPPGYPFDPGRVMLCILTSPPRWLQWP